MKFHVSSLVVLLSLSFWGYAENVPTDVFFLTVEGSSEKYGPFEFKEGEKVIIRQQAFVITKLVTSLMNNALKAKLERIIIPQLDFRQANIVDVITYIHSQSIIADKTSPGGDKGVNLIVNLRNSKDEQAQISTVPTITLTLRNVSVMDAIRFVTEVTGLQFRIENNTVVIEPRALRENGATDNPE